MGNRAEGERVRGLRQQLLAAAVWLAAAACGHHDVPAALVGHWTSSDPRYAGRTLVISHATIAFGIGPATSHSFVIEDVESETATDGSGVHEVRYRDTEGERRTVRLRTLPHGAPGLRFDNHDELWVRSGAGPALSKEG